MANPLQPPTTSGANISGLGRIACIFWTLVCACGSSAFGIPSNTGIVARGIVGLPIVQDDPTELDAVTISQRANRLFARDNLVAWCIVPFDAAKRNSADRVQMLRELGLSRCAYDWRE